MAREDTPVSSPPPSPTRPPNPGPPAQPGARRLVAYLVPRDAGAPARSVAELRAFAGERLPEHMVPAAFVRVLALPLTANGKLDRRALPAPEAGARPEVGETFVAPGTAAEEALAHIWASVLRLDRVGIHDNFFVVGGDSILSIQIVARARQAGLLLTPRQIFQHPTVAGLAAFAGRVDASGGAAPGGAAAEQGPVTGRAEPTPIQRWWLEQEVADAHHYNQSFLLQAREALDAAALEGAVSALLDHHDALRLRLVGPFADARLVFAAPCAGAGAAFQRVDLQGAPEAERRARIEQAAAEAQASLDLGVGPIARVVLFDLGASEPARQLRVSHHLAVDGVSWQVLLDDLWVGYEQRRRG